LIYDTGKKYVYAHSFCPIQGGLVLFDELNKISDDLASRYYYVKHVDNIGKYKLYRMFAQEPLCVLNTIQNNNDNNNTTSNRELPPQIIVKYQNQEYRIDLHNGEFFTFQDVVNILKQREPIFSTLNPDKQLIRFMFSGRIYRNDNFNEVAVPGIYQLMVTQKGTRGGKPKYKTKRFTKRNARH
jgi:hypothetical protein